MHLLRTGVCTDCLRSQQQSNHLLTCATALCIMQLVCQDSTSKVLYCEWCSPKKPDRKKNAVSNPFLPPDSVAEQLQLVAQELEQVPSSNVQVQLKWGNMLADEVCPEET